MLKYYDGAEEMTVLAVPTANLLTTNAYVVSYNSTNNELEMVAQSGGSDTWGADQNSAGFGIDDANGNELVAFGTTASAVNHVKVTNQSTGQVPVIEAVGDDTNISLSIAPKAAGDLILDGLKWPQADGTANYVIETDGAGQLSWAAQSGSSPAHLKSPVRLASTASKVIATELEDGDSFDGISLITGDRILLKDQATASENGIYVVQASGAAVRATDMASSSAAASVWVIAQEGANNTDTGWLCTNNSGSDVVATSNLVFAQFPPDVTVPDGIDYIGLSDTATIDVDLSGRKQGCVFKVTVTASRTLTFSNPTVGQTFLLHHRQDATGGHSPTWPTTIAWPGGVETVLTATSDAFDVFQITCVDSGTPLYVLSHVSADSRVPGP